MNASVQGLVVLESSCAAVYANAEALQILAYPEDPRLIRSLDAFLAKRLQTVLEGKDSIGKADFVVEVQSGRRRYRCRGFPVTREWSIDDHPGVALVMERCWKTTLEASQVAEQFRLTRRERQVVDLLMQGLTSKEIAGQMSISPNTVKSFLRLIMVKMGVSTRSGIIGKIFEVA